MTESQKANKRTEKPKQPQSDNLHTRPVWRIKDFLSKWRFLRHVLFWDFSIFSRSPASAWPHPTSLGRDSPRIRADVDPEGV
ncbi:hypothetical protein SRHO_G00194540 [Serrasalmus rhombeus]